MGPGGWLGLLVDVRHSDRLTLQSSVIRFPSAQAGPGVSLRPWVEVFAVPPGPMSPALLMV